MRARRSAIVSGTMWQRPTSGILVSCISAIENGMLTDTILLALAAIPEDLENRRRSPECDDRLRSMFKIVS